MTFLKYINLKIQQQILCGHQLFYFVSPNGLFIEIGQLNKFSPLYSPVLSCKFI